MKIIGIDYSLTCPCCCVVDGGFNGDNAGLDNCQFFYLTSVKKYEGTFLEGQITGHLFAPWTSQQERHDNISEWVFDKVIRSTINPYVFIENYSFGSKGRVFNLAENTGLLKHKLYKKGIKFETLVPSVIKKLATGKGNADKEKMYDKFYEETGVNMMEALDQTTLNNPVTDIVDSFYIARTGYETTISKIKQLKSIFSPK